MKRTLTICPYCGTGCALWLLTENGRAVGVEPVREHPVSRGGLCVKGWNAAAFINHPERLKTPLVRKDGVLTPATWDEALDRVVSGIRDLQRLHGNDAMMFASSAKATNEENYLLMKLARAVFGTNNIDHCARLCHSSTVTGLAQTFGSGAMTNSVDSIEHADLIFVIGSNTTEQHPLIGTRILKAVQNGAKLIVADNRLIRLARHADIHIRHKNGSDVALLLAMMNQIQTDGLADQEFIESRTEGFAEFQDSFASWTPQAAAAITGVDPSVMADAARLYASAKSALIFYSMGITQHSHGVDNVRCVAALAMMTGNLGREGAGVCPLRGQNNVQGGCDMGALPDLYSGYQKVADPLVRDKFAKVWGCELPSNPGLPLTHAMNAAHDGKIKGMFIMGENPALSDPDQNHAMEALKSLDLLVVQDIFLTETAQLAHVVLPAACYGEKDGTFTNTERRIQLLHKALEPPGEARADWEIVCELACRAGCQGMNYASTAEIMAEAASLTPIYGGVSHERLTLAGLQWPCPASDHSGTPILHRENFTRGKGKFIPVSYRPPMEEPDADYPLMLTTGRTYFHWHTGSMTRRTHLLDREERRSFVEISPIDAASHGIREGGRVTIVSRRGEVTAFARVTGSALPGVLFIPFHFAEGAANVLTNNQLDPESHIPEFKVCAVRIGAAP
ncbi:MAG: formate dehydrogenase subunit alpha [Geobacteraceae bacterium]|nr:formate dehydrogenase subunit alpha [Geobacteraceae bacterium]